jgi:hypothetical protein
MKRYLTYITVVVAGIALVFAATALARRQVVHAGNLYLADDGGISPSVLPRHEAVPVVAHLKGEIGTLDGSHPPAVRTVNLDIDKTIGVNAKGLPVCKQSLIVARETAIAKKVCDKAMIGSGEGEVEVAFPEQRPFSAQGPVVLFNGGVQGRTTTVLVHAYVAVPAPTAIVTVAEITRIHRGPFGLHILARIPRIAGGYGSVTRFDLTVGRKFPYKGKERSYLTASCPSGSYKTQGQILFSDGTTLGETHVFPCTPKE